MALPQNPQLNAPLISAPIGTVEIEGKSYPVKWSMQLWNTMLNLHSHANSTGGNSNTTTGIFQGTLQDNGGTHTLGTTAINYRVTGPLAVLYPAVTNFVGTSTSTDLWLTGLPAILQPSAGAGVNLQTGGLCLTFDNSLSVLSFFQFVAPNAGTIVFAKAASVTSFSVNGYTAAGNKGLMQQSPIIYPLV